MLYPQNGSMAKGSRRRLPTAPAWAAGVSDAMMERRNTPSSQSWDWKTSGTAEAGGPPEGGPSAPNFIQQMSSPTVSTFQPSMVGMSMARLVLSPAEGNAPAM